MIKKQYKHPHGLNKFLILVAILAAYAIFVIVKFGVKDGLSATLLTWSFFVLCTPIADAGFLVDFPVRVVTGLKMLWSEVIVWAVAISAVIFNLLFNVQVFEKLDILELFHNIITHPWPLWGIVAVSAIGTFLSINVGDQIFTMVKEKRHHKHIKKLQIKRLILELIAFVAILGVYALLLSLTGITI